jgi:glycogen debranching enzyme
MPKRRKSSYGKSPNSKAPRPSLSIPKARSSEGSRSPTGSPVGSLTPSTPKTPADEGIEFFQSDLKDGESPIRVYELRLDPDGGPGQKSSVERVSFCVFARSLTRRDQYIRLPPAYRPYILRVSLDAGTPASKNGVFKTNFPLDGGKFGRDRFTKRK